MAKVKQVFLEPLGKNNPVFAQILGICSTLAVTNRLDNTVVMTLGVLFTTTLSSFTISLLRKYIPSRIRMMVETLIIASYVIVVDIVLRAYYPDIWKQLGPYVGLIITNCIVMGRCEAFATANAPGASFLDGLGAGIGYTIVLVSIAVVREILGFGTLWGIALPARDLWFHQWVIMVMPPGAFFMLALVTWYGNANVLRRTQKEAK